MKEDHYILLLQKQLSGDLTLKEKSALAHWLAASAQNEKVAKSVRKAWELSEGFSQEVDLDLDVDFLKIEERIAEQGNHQAKVRPLLHRRWILRVAAAIVLVVAGNYILQNYLQPAAKYQVATAGNEPSEKAIQLQDGSKIWLNANTELSYFTNSISKERRVKLDGEAFFEVAKDASKPFIVETPSGEVTVLGTSFSVKERTEIIEVNVATGQVKLSPIGSKQAITMTANEQGIFNKKTGELRKNTSPVSNKLAWHTGQLMFDNTPLVQTIKTIQDFYSVKISLSDEGLQSCPVTATFAKKTIESVLETLATLLGAEVEKAGEANYLLKGGSC